MELIMDLIEFLGITGIILLVSAIYLIRNRWVGRFANHSNGNYQTNGNGYTGNSMFQSDDNNTYSYNQHDESDSSRKYDGLHGTGDYIMNGSHDEQLDFSNPNHYPIIDSYDNNIDEDNPTQPW